MTSTIAKDASNGAKTETKPAQRDYGIAVLRDKETKALIGLAATASRRPPRSPTRCTASSTTATPGPPAELQQQLDEALSCWQTADHYLRMLDSVLEERNGDSPVPWRPTDSLF